MRIGNVDLPIGHGAPLTPVGVYIFPVVLGHQKRGGIGAVVLRRRNSRQCAALQRHDFPVLQGIIHALGVLSLAVVARHGQNAVRPVQKALCLTCIQKHNGLVADLIPAPQRCHQRVQCIGFDIQFNSLRFGLGFCFGIGFCCHIGLGVRSGSGNRLRLRLGIGSRSARLRLRGGSRSGGGRSLGLTVLTGHQHTGQASRQ